MATNFGPHECVIFVQSMKIDTHENKAIHSISFLGLIKLEECLKDENFFKMSDCLSVLMYWYVMQ